MLKFTLLFDTNATYSHVGNSILTAKVDILCNEFENNAPKLSFKTFIFQKSLVKLQNTGA